MLYCKSKTFFPSMDGNGAFFPDLSDMYKNNKNTAFGLV
jgi:hypothetical protein